MAWSPRHIDKPLRFIYDPEVWLVSSPVLGTLVFIGVNQVISLIATLIFGWILQKIVDKNKKGYLLHMLNYYGLWRIFPPLGKYRF